MSCLKAFKMALSAFFPVHKRAKEGWKRTSQALPCPQSWEPGRAPWSSSSNADVIRAWDTTFPGICPRSRGTNGLSRDFTMTSRSIASARHRLEATHLSSSPCGPCLTFIKPGTFCPRWTDVSHEEVVTPERKGSVWVIKLFHCKASKHLDDDFLTLDNGTSKWPSHSWLSSHPWIPSRAYGRYYNEALEDAVSRPLNSCGNLPASRARCSPFWLGNPTNYTLWNRSICCSSCHRMGLMSLSLLPAIHLYHCKCPSGGVLCMKH